MRYFAIAAAFGLTALLGADVVMLPAAADNTMFREATAPFAPLSSGAGQSFFCGRTAFHIDVTQRGLIRFDVSAIPANAEITSVRLRLYLISGGGGLQQAPVALHRVTHPWGEGPSVGSGGSGAPSEPGDANWYAAFYPDIPWFTPGGDFEAAASANRTVGRTEGFVEFASTPALAADVQGWLAAPASVHGWLLKGNEGVNGSARQFAAREHLDPTLAPVLIVEFTVPCDPDFTCDGNADQDDVACLIDAVAGNPGCECQDPDFNVDGNVDQGDVEALINVVAGGGCP